MPCLSHSGQRNRYIPVRWGFLERDTGRAVYVGLGRTRVVRKVTTHTFCHHVLLQNGDKALDFQVIKIQFEFGFFQCEYLP